MSLLGVVPPGTRSWLHAAGARQCRPVAERVSSSVGGGGARTGAVGVRWCLDRRPARHGAMGTVAKWGARS